MLALAVLAGCGSDTGTAAPSDDPSSGRADRADGRGEVRSSGQGKRTFELTCDPAGGDHPDPEAACAALDELESPFAPVPADEACTEIYGGPQTARVTGTFRGEPVDAEFDRTNGCEISRWDAHVDLLVETGGA